MPKAEILPKYIYAVYDGQLVRADIDNGLSGPIDFGRPIPKGAFIHTAMSNDPNLTLEQVTDSKIMVTDFINGELKAAFPTAMGYRHNGKPPT